MNKLLTKIASLFFGMGLAIGVGAAIGNQRPLEARAEEEAYTLDATSVTGGSNGYASESADIEYDGIKWSAVGNTTLSPWRLGGKSLSGVDRDVWSQSPISTENISKVVVTFGSANSITVNSVKLSVGNTAHPTSKDVDGGEFKANGSMTFERPAEADWSNMYFSFHVNVSVSGTSNKFVEFKTATFYYEPAPSSESIVPTGISTKDSSENPVLDGSTFEYTGDLLATQSFSVSATYQTGEGYKDGSKFAWDSSDKSVATIAGSNENAVVTVLSKGQTTISVATTDATGSNNNIGMSFTLDTTNAVAVPGSDVSNPYTVAQARAAIDATTGVTGVYAQGIVSEVIELSTQYKNMTYNISTDGTTTSDQLQVFRGKYIDGADFTQDNAVEVGDEVIVYGNLKKFGDTYEFDSNNRVISVTRTPKVRSITLTPNEIELMAGDEGTVKSLFTSIEIEQDEGCGKTVDDIVFTSSDENVLLIVEGDYIAGDEGGNATISATIDDVVYGTASVTVSVDVKLEGITITNVEYNYKEIARASSFQLEWEYNPTNTSDKDVQFRVAEEQGYNKGEITVSQTGLISAGTIPGTAAYVYIESVNDPTIYDLVWVEVVMDEMYITIGEGSSWEKVNDPSTLTAGDKVLFTGVKAEVAYAMGTYTSGNNIKADTEHPLTIVDDVVTDGVQDSMIYTLETGSVAGSYAFKDSNNKYICAVSSSSNNMKTQDEINGNSSFIIGEDSSVVAQGSYSRKSIRYNNTSTSNLFSCYAEGSTTGDAVVFFKLNEAEKVAVTAELYNAVVGFNELFTCDEDGKTFAEEDFLIAAMAFDGLDQNILDALKVANSNEKGNLVEQFLARYDYAVGKWDSKLEADLDFLAREPAPVPSGSYVPLGSNAKSNAAATVIIIIAVLGVTAFGVYFLLRKRKEER